MAAAKFQFTKKALENMVPTASRQYVRDAQESSLGAYLTPNGVTSFMSSVMSTHPPLGERIRRIDPIFSGDLEYDYMEGFLSTQGYD